MNVNLNPKEHILTRGSALFFQSQWESAPHAAQVTQHVPTTVAINKSNGPFYNTSGSLPNGPLVFAFYFRTVRNWVQVRTWKIQNWRPPTDTDSSNMFPGNGLGK